MSEVRRAPGAAAGECIRRPGRRLFLAGAASTAIILVCGRGLDAASEGENPAAKAPARAAGFTLFDVGEGRWTLSDLLRDGPILLEFMSLDCPHCRDMAPVLARLHEVFRGRLRFVTVAYDRNVHRVRGFIRQEGHTWTYLMGNPDVARAYRVDGVPTFFLIASDGRIISRQVGSTSAEAMARWIEQGLDAR